MAAIDAATNQDPTPATANFRIDATPPETTITVGPSNPTTDFSPEFDFVSNEPGTFVCSIDFGAFVPCASPFSEAMSLGTHVFQVAAIDLAQNADPTPASWSFAIENGNPPTVPDTFITSAPPDLTHDATLSFSFVSDDPLATFSCAFDTDSFAACASPFVEENAAEGLHAFAVRASNAYGTDPTPATAFVTVDRAAPTTAIDFDRRAIAVDASGLNGDSDPVAQALFILDENGSDRTQLTDSWPGGEGARVLQWSPDGAYVSLMAESSTPTPVGIVSRDGPTVGFITSDFWGVSFLPAWAPDSRHLAASFAMDENAIPTGIQVSNTDGSLARTVPLPENIASAFDLWPILA
ncbi:MAG: TolB family protein, partial [Thermoanaerobaculia bacterium]